MNMSHYLNKIDLVLLFLLQLFIDIMIDKLPNDMLTEVKKYLSYLDYINLKPVCRRTSSLQMDFRQIIINKLSKHITNPEELLKVIKENDAIITGSFILACINNTVDYNDVDIYENTKDNYGRLSKYLFNQEDTSFREANKKSGEWKYKVELYNECYNVRDFMVQGTNLQHIRIECDVRKYINNVFDLDICKNFFDGSRLYIRSTHKLIEKYDYIKPNAQLMELYMGADLETKLEDRLKKYTLRGYNIRRHPKFDEIVAYISNAKEYNRSVNLPTFKYAYDLVSNNLINLDLYYLE